MPFATVNRLNIFELVERINKRFYAGLNERIQSSDRLSKQDEHISRKMGTALPRRMRQSTKCFHMLYITSSALDFQLFARDLSLDLKMQMKSAASVMIYAGLVSGLAVGEQPIGDISNFHVLLFSQPAYHYVASAPILMNGFSGGIIRI